MEPTGGGRRVTTRRLVSASLTSAAALLGVFVVAGAALGANPIGLEFQVNSYTTGHQNHVSVSVDADGDFVVVWASFGNAGSDPFEPVQGQRYDASGNAVGSEFQVNTYTTLGQVRPSVSVDAGGGFVVVWHSAGSAGSDTSNSIQGQRYDASGNAVGSEFQVNSYTTSVQADPVVDVDADGDFVVIWQSYGSSGSDTAAYSVQGQRYDAGGSAIGSQFQVNSYTTGSQQQVSVSVDVDGDFVVVWESFGSAGSDTSPPSVQGQRYDASVPEFQVNSYTTSAQDYPSVAVDAGGDFVVVWHSYGSAGSDSSYRSIQGQRYDASGNAVGSEFQVNTYTTGNQNFPSVAVDSDGDFVVVWQSYGSVGGDSSYGSIQGRRYDASGNPVGSEFQVNTYTM